MGAWTHDQYRSRARRPQGRQPHLGRPVQYLLLDRPDDADRRRDHDADPPLRRPAGASGLSAIRARDLPRAWVSVKNCRLPESPILRTIRESGLWRQPLTPTLSPQERGEGEVVRRFNLNSSPPQCSPIAIPHEVDTNSARPLTSTSASRLRP